MEMELCEDAGKRNFSEKDKKEILSGLAIQIKRLERQTLYTYGVSLMQMEQCDSK